MKIFKIVLLLCVFHQFVFAQCNTSVLDIRAKSTDASMKQKVIGIRLMTRIYSDLIKDINKMGAKAGKRIKASLDQGKQPNMTSYINTLKAEKKKIEKRKKVDEIKKLEELVYCYLDFELSFYNEVQTIIKENNLSNIRSEIAKIIEPFFTKEDAKIEELNKEIQSIEIKYPIHVTSK